MKKPKNLLVFSTFLLGVISPLTFVQADTSTSLSTSQNTSISEKSVLKVKNTPQSSISNNPQFSINENDNIASGVFGTSSWYITSEGILHIGPGEFPSIDLSGVTGLEHPDWHDYASKITNIILDGKVTAAPNSSMIFAQLPNVLSIENLNLLDTSKVTDMYGMFGWNTNLKELDLSSFNTENVTSMEKMISSDPNLETLNLSSFNTQNVTNMSIMLYGTLPSKLTLGPNTHLDTAVVALGSRITNPNFYGVWQEVTDENRDPWSGDDLSMLQRKISQSTTYEWQKKGKIVVEYLDENMNQIHEPQEIDTAIGKLYDVSTEVYKLNLVGYTLDDTKLPINLIGKLNNTNLTIKYIYSENHVIINTHDSNIYIGDKWEPKDNFDSAFDKKRHPLDFSQIEVDESKVDTSKEGTYEVTYTYEGVTSVAKINVKEKKKALINTHDSNINVGDKWDPKDNFDSAFDKEGNSVDLSQITVDSSKLDTSVPGIYNVDYTYDGVISTAKIIVKNTQALINVHDSTIYKGSFWNPKDNFDSATDEQGNSLDFSQITVDSSKVDPSAPGTYDVTYTYNGVTSIAKITVQDKPIAIPNTNTSSNIKKSPKPKTNHTTSNKIKKDKSDKNALPKTGEASGIIFTIIGILTISLLCLSLLFKNKILKK